MAVDIRRVVYWLAIILAIYIVISLIFHTHHAIVVNKIYRTIVQKPQGLPSSAQWDVPHWPDHVTPAGNSPIKLNPAMPNGKVIRKPDNGWSAKVGWEQDSVEVKQRDLEMSQGMSAF